ncbi:hypothetical protein [Microbacterium suwonense]|uniref:Uncharacterized protein n=1 Tax=Microbacterium suwonense TaxID=683047 RepID=A0ABN6X6W6_9MICO|nr:hypothetical protein [Microbacterium suwonense]BDZ39121.1 hypothetical protein GCM10025863_17350 [Microbacterium suwonense]
MLSSRLIPGLDGGYTIATAARARQLAERGADVQVLTVDPADAAAHAAHRAEFVRLGMLPAAVPLRNLFDEAGASSGGAAEWLSAAARSAPCGSHAATAEQADEYREITDAESRPILALPVISGDPDWHLSTAPVRVYDEHGDTVGALPGFGGLYRAWLDHLVEQAERPVVVICESRQLGELLAGWPHPGRASCTPSTPCTWSRRTRRMRH